MTVTVPILTKREAATEAVEAGMYVTDEKQLAWVVRTNAKGAVLEVAGGLGDGYDPDEAPVLLRQSWTRFKACHWRVVVPKGDD